MISFQSPVDPSTSQDLVATVQALGWVDKTAIGVLLVFFVLGLFKGLIWQVSRIGIMVAAYFVAGRFGHDVAKLLGASDPTAANVAGNSAAAAGAGNGVGGMSQLAGIPQGETTLYVAYCLLFVAVLIVLSLAAMLIKKLADRAGLSFFDRIGGGVLGVATGACVVLALLFGINMFFPSSQLAQAADGSHSLRWSQQAISWLGEAVDDDLRTVLSLQPLTGSGNPANTIGTSANPNSSPGQPIEVLPPGTAGDEQIPKMPTPLPLPPGMTLDTSKIGVGNGTPAPSPGTTAPGATTAPGTTVPGGGDHR